MRLNCNKFVLLVWLYLQRCLGERGRSRSIEEINSGKGISWMQNGFIKIVGDY